MADAILALNAGSSSVKFGLFTLDADANLTEVQRGEIDAAIADPSAPKQKLADFLETVQDKLGDHALAAVGHRIVHGGSRFVDPVGLSDEVMKALDALTPLAPLHQPRSLDPVRAFKSLRPELLQVGCFDTAFHHRLAPPVSRFAIPRQYEAQGVRRYGFHGLSYAYIAQCLADLPNAVSAKKTVVAHLGSGASLCAMQGGKSVDTTMGFTALDGLVMGTRCGAIDPGVLLYLQQACGLGVDDVEDMLYHHSGLLGVSGISSDVRELTSSRDHHAAEALELFSFSVSRETAAMANTLGGLECLVFTGGIGQHAAVLRADICERLRWLGVVIDEDADKETAAVISAPESAVEVRVIPTDEEIMIAQGAAGVLKAN
jgi:acetate kinase